MALSRSGAPGVVVVEIREATVAAERDKVLVALGLVTFETTGHENEGMAFLTYDGSPDCGWATHQMAESATRHLTFIPVIVVRREKQ